MSSNRKTVSRVARIILPWLFLFMSSCAMIDRMSGMGQAAELSRTGLPARAEILRIWDTGVTVNDDPVVGFLLEVRPPDETPFRAETRLCISRVHIPQFQPGAVVPVFYDPRDHRRVSLDIYDFR